MTSLIEQDLNLLCYAWLTFSVISNIILFANHHIRYHSCWYQATHKLSSQLDCKWLPLSSMGMYGLTTLYKAVTFKTGQRWRYHLIILFWLTKKINTIKIRLWYLLNILNCDNINCQRVWVLHCLMTPGLSKDIQCHDCITILFSRLVIPDQTPGHT